jgi:hypothetical protein
MAAPVALAQPSVRCSQDQPESARTSRDAPDRRVRLQTPINVQVSTFDETESVLSLAPAQQVDWARAYASGAGRRANAREIVAAVRRRFPDDPPAMRAQTALIVQLILMGDIVGAMRSHQAQLARDERRPSREFTAALGQAERTQSTIIRRFARDRPPRAYAGANSLQAARAQNRMARYTQFVQASTQLMNELQNSERELVDALQSMNRNIETFWESYAGFREEDFRTTERVMSTR